MARESQGGSWTCGSIASKAIPGRSAAHALSNLYSFSNYFITIAVGTGIATIVSILVFSFIDTDAAVYLNEQMLLVTKQSMERFGASQEIITQALAEASTKDNFSVVNQLVSYVFRVAFYALTGLVVALILKKSDTNQE